MNRYFELGVYDEDKTSDGTGALARYSSIGEAKEAIEAGTFTKEDNQIFIIDELEEQENGSIRQLGEWKVR